MHILSILLPTLLLASPIACRGRSGGSSVHVAPIVVVDSSGGASRPHSSTTCSANQSGSVPDWAANPAWATNMTTCLQTMDNDGWNGAECQPALADGTKLGPSFGFYKGEDKWDGDGDTGSSCYAECADCLMQGINWNQAQTTTCEYEYYTKMGVTRHHCDMGFEYGK